ncbi:MAG: CBS domain-containing protein [Bacteroidales bacterium]|nr:CBS domain-containing protein [Bacteroidales bacterium]
MSGFFAKDLKPEAIPTVKTSSTVSEVLQIFRDYKINHLAIVNNEEYLGLIDENEILGFKKSKQAIGALPLKIISVFGKISDNVLDLLYLFITHKLSVLPIVDRKNRFVKYCSPLSLLESISELLSAHYPGAVIMLELPVRDYSLTHISSIIEENNAHVLATFVHTCPDSMLMQVFLKLDTQDVSYILPHFERFNYHVLALSGENFSQDIFEERLQLLFKYLNM